MLWLVTSTVRPPTPLPPDLTHRPLTPADAAATFAVFAAAEEHDTGEVAIELEDIESDWQRPSFDLATQSVGIFDGDELVAAGEVYRGRRGEASVHPEHRGRGIGSWLVRWTEDCARRHGGTVVGQTVPADGSAERMFQALGYQQGWTSWVLEVPPGSSIEPQPLPEGYRLRDFVPGQDENAAFRVIEDAFGEWPDRQPSTLGDWAARTTQRPGFEPWQLRLIESPEEEVVGAAFTILAGECGYIDQLAVRADQRNRGLARALLVDAFERARAKGLTRSELATDSRTGALPLYEHVGMVVTKTYRHWQIDLA
jgi:GNAT superfamily N-acetyltransferase